jgi:glycosyltransferase involved in cell wall biosynthesis
VARRSGVADAVEFAGHLTRQQLLNSLDGYTALVFPSLHDSGGLVVLEALSKGLPVVCLDLGGPGVMVNKACGIVVPTAHADEAQTVSGVANAMTALGVMPTAEWKRLSVGAIARANELSWDKLTDDLA